MNWTRIQSIRTLEVSRAFRFAPAERPALFATLGIAHNSRVLEVGCGTGIFTRYLADGAPDGYVIGIDATADFVAFAKARRASPRLDFALGDAYALPVADGVMDATTSYTLMAILQDPAAALREQMRVVRTGGVVSAIEVLRGGIGHWGRPHARLPGDEETRLSALRGRWNTISSQFVEPMERGKFSFGWQGRVEELPLEFERAGLRQVRLSGFLSTFSTSDESYDRGQRRWFLEELGRHEVESVEQAWAEWRGIYEEHGVFETEVSELCELVRREQALRLRDFDEGRRAWAWHGTAHLIVAGIV
ncbi:MAG: methyltransferase domain-containing protein [Chloroflexota bacterium]|nr:methyltransferase domain-containing protein [Chloroflexota bacterium]